MKKWILLLMLSCLLAGCADSVAEPTEPQPTQQIQTTVPVLAVEAEAEALAEEVPPPTGVVLEPVAPGEQEERSDVAVVDYSNAEEGYIMAFYYGETDKRLKLLLKGPATTYNYDLPRNQWVVLPLSDGDGSYQAGIYRNVGGSEYAMASSSEYLKAPSLSNLAS